MKALNHPVRTAALTILTERVASPKEISEEVDAPIGNVSYHVRVLEELGLVELWEEDSTKGSVAHFYKAIERPLIDIAGWEKLDPKVRNVVSGRLLEGLFDDAARSLATGYFDRREDRHASRTPLLLDEKGWQRVAAIHAKALESILKEQAAATTRMNGSSDSGIHAVVGMFCFEVPADAGE